MKIAILVPHVFMWNKIKTIFAPARLALDLAEGLEKLGHEVTFFSPGPVDTKVKNINSDLTYFTEEVEAITKLKIEDGAVSELIKNKPLTFLTLSRQIQSDLISRCYKMANQGEFDIVHVYTNEEETAMAFSELVKVPTVFTHHEPFNFLARYRTNFQKYKHLNFISISKSQQKAYPDINFVGNVYHGIDANRFEFNNTPKDYFAFLGRIIKPKGVHLAIQACLETGQKLEIAGKHYSGHGGDRYWEEKIEPFIDGKQIEYVGYISTDAEKSEFLGNAKGLLMPVQWEEPFGMVMLEAMACGTPVVGFAKGSIPEVVKDKVTGIVVEDLEDMKSGLGKINEIDRKEVRDYVEKEFSLKNMAQQHEKIYKQLI